MLKGAQQVRGQSQRVVVYLFIDQEELLGKYISAEVSDKKKGEKAIMSPEGLNYPKPNIGSNENGLR